MTLRTINNDEYLELFAKAIYMDRLIKATNSAGAKEATEKIERVLRAQK